MTRSGRKDSDKLAASELALESYLDAMLEEPGEQEEPVRDAAVSTAAAYHLFEVSGLLVAVATNRVCAEIPLPALEEQGQVSAHPDWLRRTATADGAMIVDTALLVLPEDLAPRLVPLQKRCNTVLLVDDGNWGVALEGVGREETIATDAVCWRGPRGKRPWLGGTLASSRCVVLDLENIQQWSRSAAGQP